MKWELMNDTWFDSVEEGYGLNCLVWSIDFRIWLQFLGLKGKA
jgi:hypothetical protein